MNSDRNYKALQKQCYTLGDFSIVPIRYQDRIAIMEWRNEQMYHLRQATVLTPEKQEEYFKTTIAELFVVQQPKQILFSFLKNGVCIGYGGLVHINWVDKNAEISFIMNTTLEKERFSENWSTFLQLIEQVAFQEVNVHKLTTYAFDLRPHLYPVLEASGYTKEAVLKEQCLFNGDYINVVLHAKTNPFHAITIRKAQQSDVTILFDWTNDKQVRSQSYNTAPITFETHTKWFQQKLNDTGFIMYIFEVAEKPIGLVKIEDKQAYSLIGVSIDALFRGKGLASILLRKACNTYFKTIQKPIHACIKKENKASINAFKKAGFVLLEEQLIQNSPSYIFKLEN